MNWRVFQFWFIAGTILAAYSQHTGATGFKTASDLVAAGVLFGAVGEALWFVMSLNAKLLRRF